MLEQRKGNLRMSSHGSWRVFRGSADEKEVPMTPISWKKEPRTFSKDLKIDHPTDFP